MSTLEAPRASFGAARWAFLDGLRCLAAWTAMGASELLTRVALRLLPSTIRRPQGPGQLEFHSDTGNSGGALYLDGEWVARLPGVTRL